MKLVYSKRRCIQADVVHRFDVLGELLPADLDVLKNSIQIFFDQLNRSGNQDAPLMVLDFSESTIKINENKLQLFVSEMKTMALAAQVHLSIAQSDIESMHAEQKAIEASLLSKINFLENKLNLMESVNQQIQNIQNENSNMREKLKESAPKKAARTIFERLWGEA